MNYDKKRGLKVCGQLRYLISGLKRVRHYQPRMSSMRLRLHHVKETNYIYACIVKNIHFLFT